jgi:lipopolysaccharide biosynthesis glycosyltransferase
MCVSIPPTRWSEEVIELSRLVAKEGNEYPLTKLISHSLKEMRRKWDLIVSFADNTQNHHGGIYQAASWHFAGFRKPSMDGCIIDGRFISGRSCNSRWGTRSPKLLKEILQHCTIEPHFDHGKYLYWKPLRKSGKAKAARLQLQSLRYPKPSNQPTII